MSSPISRRSIGSTPRTTRVQVEHLGLEHLLRLNASSCRVSRAARSRRVVRSPRASSRTARRVGQRVEREARVPAVMTVSRLLKSCATPPASWPTASIFCDCRSCASSAAALAHVAEDHVEHALGALAHGRQAVLHGHRLAAAVAQHALDRQRRPGRGAGPQARQVGRGDADGALGDPRGQQLLARVADQLAQALVDVEQAAVRVVDRDGVGGVREQGAEAPLAVAQRRLGPAPRRQVAGDGEHVRLAAGVHRAEAHLDRHGRAVLPAVDAVEGRASRRRVRGRRARAAPPGRARRRRGCGGRAARRAGSRACRTRPGSRRGASRRRRTGRSGRPPGRRGRGSGPRSPRGRSPRAAGGPARRPRPAPRPRAARRRPRSSGAGRRRRRTRCRAPSRRRRAPPGRGAARRRRRRCRPRASPGSRTRGRACARPRRRAGRRR